MRSNWKQRYPNPFNPRFFDKIHSLVFVLDVQAVRIKGMSIFFYFLCFAFLREVCGSGGKALGFLGLKLT